jgi:hypothetical protein
MKVMGKMTWVSPGYLQMIPTAEMAVPVLLKGNTVSFSLHSLPLEFV